MLTPERIREYRFQLAGQGIYRADDVDRFFASVCTDYETIYTEHGKLIDRIRMLVDKVKSLEAEIKTYEDQENLIKKTLIVAQKKADEIENNAKTHCESTVAAADRQAAETKSSAEKEAKELLTAAQDRSKRILTEVEQKSKDILSGAGATAEKTIGTAKSRATVMLSEAKQRADQIVADARAQADAVLGPLQAEVAKEKKALEDVRAESKAFKKKITESYYRQIGMTSELLGFVENEEGVAVAQSAVEASAAAQPIPEEPAAPAETLLPEDMAFLDSVDTFMPTEDDLFTAILEETVNETQGDADTNAVEPIAEAPAAAQASDAAAEQAADTQEADDAEAPEEVQQEEEGHFSFVNGFSGFGFDEAELDDVQQEIPEEPVMSFDDIFNSVVAETPEPQPPVAQQAKPFGSLNEKYRSVSETERVQEEEDEAVFGSMFRKSAPIEDEVEVEEPTRRIALPDEEPDEEPAPFEEKKPEKKKRRLSLFSKYEDEDEDDDEDDYDEDEDDEDDEDDDEDSSGFHGFLRK